MFSLYSMFKGWGKTTPAHIPARAYVCSCIHAGIKLLQLLSTTPFAPQPPNPPPHPRH